METEIIYIKTESLLNDVTNIIETSQNYAYKAVNYAIIQRNWLLGKRIAEENFNGEKRADYGKQVINKLSIQLTEKYGKGFDSSNLYKYVSFYNSFPILDTVSLNSFSRLTWSHFRTLLQVEDKTTREWYAKEASNETWSVRTLQRNISSQYYERILLSQHKEIVKQEMNEKTAALQDKLEFIKNPIVAEFLGLSQNTDFTESELEKADNDNPTLGIVLCSDTDEDIAKYSILHGNEQLFATKYKLYLPDESKLKAEIESQKEIFRLQHENK